MATRPVPTIEINLAWCKRCGICSAFCPRKVFTTDVEGTPIVANPDECIDCEICERMCPDLAIRLTRPVVHSTSPEAQR